MSRHRSSGFWAVLLWLGAWSVAAIFIFPIAAAIAVVWLGYQLFRLIGNLPAVRALRDGHRSRKIYRKALLVQEAGAPPSPEAFARHVVELASSLKLGMVSPLSVQTLARSLYTKESIKLVPPAPGALSNGLAAARYRDQLATWMRKFSNPTAVGTAQDAILKAVTNAAALLPPSPVPEKASPSPISTNTKHEEQFTVRFADLLSNVPQAVEAICGPFQAREVIEAGLFETLRDQLEGNLLDMSGAQRHVERDGTPKLVSPTQHKGSDEEIIQGYLKDTPLKSLLHSDVPFVIPEAVRSEHHWIVAGSGHGKSQTLQYMIVDDFPRVAVGQASTVVIDSQGDLIRNIARLKLFAEGQPLHNKLCLIDPSDLQFPAALNLFDAGTGRISTYSELDRERLTNGVLELYDFVLGSLLSAELTQKQGVVFRYLTRLMLTIPGSTIHTFRKLMEPKGYQEYLPYIAKLDGTARAFFETEFNSPQFVETKRQVVRRLWGILENRTFERMFSHPKNKLDLFSEMNSGKVILINCAKDLLKQNGTEIFGRFFIALIAQAAQERATLPENRRLPVHVYLDEAADYLDQNVSIILEQARKYNVGMVLAHQYIGQLSPKLQESFAANTSIKFVGGVSDKDARSFSHMLRCSSEFIEAQPKGHFAALIRNVTPRAVSLRIPFGRLEAMPRMTDAEFEQVRAMMRERYAEPWSETGGDEFPRQPELYGDSINPDAVDTRPASKW